MAIGLGVGAAILAGVGGVRGKDFEAKFDDIDNMCTLPKPTGQCADFYDAGQASNAMTVAGGVMAPLLVGAAVALLVVGLKRRAAGRETTAQVVPTLAPGFAGLSLSGRF